jgi:hypothetical protein
MPLELQIIRPPDFIRMGSLGTIDFESSKEALRQLAFTCRKRGIFRAILDVRDICVPTKPLLTTTQLAALVDTFREAGFTTSQRLAVLYRKDPHHGVRMFAFISSLKGWRVRAFDEFEKALMWLQGDDEPRPEAVGEPVSIRFQNEDRVV